MTFLAEVISILKHVLLMGVYGDCMRHNEKLNFGYFKSVSNPNSIHGIYPYRGKISALDASHIISQLPKEGTLLDPFCGSGTIVYEAQKHGLSAIGIDNNPLAITIANAKIYKNSNQLMSQCESIIEKAKDDLKNKKYDLMPSEVGKTFHPDTANEIMCVKNYFSKMNDYLKGIFYGTIALSARACNGYMWTSSTVGKNIEPKTYFPFFEKMLSKAKKNIKYLPEDNMPSAKIINGDSRNISSLLPEKSIDFVFTSPPYFDALDYTAYYGKLIYEIFGIDRIKIKRNLIQKVDTYEQDMKAVLEELDKITKDDALMIFVVGDKKVKDKVINGGEFFNNIKGASYIEERTYSGSSSQVFDVLNKTQRKEQIVVWDKKNGEIIKYEQ